MREGRISTGSAPPPASQGAGLDCLQIFTRDAKHRAY